jgi:hypothetical protein
MPKGMVDLGIVQVTPGEAADCVKMLINDAKELAGQFHGMDRSEKFRTNWPDEYKFATNNWKSFVQEVLTAYAMLMGGKNVDEVDKHRMYVARLMWEKMTEGKEKNTGLQIAKGSQQFVGDPYENRKIKRDFGSHGNFRAWLMNKTAIR